VKGDQGEWRIGSCDQEIDGIMVEFAKYPFRLAA